MTQQRRNKIVQPFVPYMAPYLGTWGVRPAHRPEELIPPKDHFQTRPLGKKKDRKQFFQLGDEKMEKMKKKLFSIGVLNYHDEFHFKPLLTIGLLMCSG